MVESDTCIRPINPREENARIHPTHAHLIPLATQNRLLSDTVYEGVVNTSDVAR